MKKRIACLITGLLVFITLMGAFPLSVAASGVTGSTSSEEIVIQRADVTTRYYRTYNGRLQYRIWSNTYEKWLTDWTDC